MKSRFSKNFCAKSPFRKDDDDKPLGNIVIVDDGSLDNNTTETDENCDNGSCPPPKPAFGTKEHRDMIKEQFKDK